MGRARNGHRRGVPGGQDVNAMAGGATGLPVIGSEANVLRLGERSLAPVSSEKPAASALRWPCR